MSTKFDNDTLFQAVNSADLGQNGVDVINTVNGDSNADGVANKQYSSLAKKAGRDGKQPSTACVPQAALDDRDEPLRDFIEGSLLPMYIRQGMRIVFANQALVDLLGYDDIEDLLSMDSVYCIIAEAAHTRAADLLARNADDKTVRIWHPISLKDKTGETINVEAYRRMIIWQGEESSFLVYRDVRAEQAAQQALIVAENRLRTILDASGQGILVHAYGKPLYANPALKKLLGHEPDAPLTDIESIFDYMPESDRLRQYQERRMSGEEVVSSYETKLLTRDQRERVIEVHALLINWDGRAALMASMDDITLRKQAENELRISEERFRDFAQTAANWFWETDENLVITDLSPEFAVMTGVPVSERIGRRVMDDTIDKFGYNEEIGRLWGEMSMHKPFRNYVFERASKAGDRLTIQVSGVPVFDQSGIFTGYRGTARDITVERKLQEKIEYDANHDELTGLPNRRRFYELLGESINRINSVGGSDLLVCVDLDGFKVVNDTAGHSVGDKLLVQCGNVFSHLIGPGDTVARLGGDEFGFLIRNVNPSDATPLLEKIIDTISSNHFFHNGQSFNVGLSAGAVAIVGNEQTQEELLSQADLACYAAKELGRNRVYYFRETDTDARRRQREMSTAAHLREAIGQNRLTLYGQAIVSLDEPGYPVDHYEILVRLRDEDGNIVPPDTFIPAAERYQLMDVIDRWVVSEALRQLVDQEFTTQAEDIRLSINLSGSSLGDPSMAQFIYDEISRWQIDPARLCFEITETAAIQNIDTALTMINQIKQLGCRFSLDDFGTGLSSFSYLQNLLVDEIKIDGTFVQELENSPVNKAVVTAVCDVGRSLGMTVVAERVEDQATADALANLGVTLGQGYLWARPIPLDQVFAQHRSKRSVEDSSSRSTASPNIARVIPFK